MKLGTISIAIATMLGLVAQMNAQLRVINGDFKDLAGLTKENDGWYAGLPNGWSGNGDDYAVKQYGSNVICNPSRVLGLHQIVGALKTTADVVLTFDVNDVFNGESVLNAQIRDDKGHKLVEGTFVHGAKQSIIARRVPSGTAISIHFAATYSTPGLENVSISAVKPGTALLKKSVSKEPITVAAYYYPCTHQDPRRDKAKYPGFTEWDEIRSAKPRFPGHVQPTPPLWGYQDESKPEFMAQKIAAAADHGVNAFIFDWYYYNDGPYLQRALDEGFLKAKNNSKVKFALMWANHDWYDIQGYNPVDKIKLLYPGKVTLETWDKICDLVISRYFRHPSYWLVDGKPYFSIYEMSLFLESFGSIEATRAALDRFRTKVKAAGFPDVYINAVVWGQPNLPGGRTPPGWPKLCKDLALDSLTSYTWVHHGALNYDTFPTSDYVWGRQKYMSFWAKTERDFSIPYFPNAMVNWDNSPRAAPNADWSHPGAHVVNPVVTGNTPAAFQTSLEMIKKRLIAMPKQPRIITINAWNEWPEGSCLEPTVQNGFGYLDAIKSVFGTRIMKPNRPPKN
jgi:hypothetical protein